MNITSTQAEARIALANILQCLNRRNEKRHTIISDLVESPSFFWLADTAGLDPHLTRIAFREELARIAAAGFGLKGQGRIRAGRKS